jgi:hypothetical protein
VNPERQVDISRRLQASFDYLPEHQRAGQRQTDRIATSLMRKAWVFDEPDIREVKDKLHYKELKAGRETVTPAKAHAFLADYFRLLSESCVLQKEMADYLAGKDSQGRQVYAANIEDALGREDRYQRLAEAMELYRKSYAHEQERFAYGSTLKVVMDGLVEDMPEAWRQIALTPRRGEFERRLTHEMLDYRLDPSPEKRQSITQTYFNGQTDEAEKAFVKYADMKDAYVKERADEDVARQDRLAAIAHKVIYGRLGEESDLPALNQRQKSSLDALDDLLWVDNDFEKVLDQKMLLDHDLYLRLQLGNLLIACYPTLERPSFGHLKPEERSQCEKKMDDLVRKFGRGAFIFGLSDTELERRLKLIEPKLAERLAPKEQKRQTLSNPFSA